MIPLSAEMEPPLQSVWKYLRKRNLSADWHPTITTGCIKAPTEGMNKPSVYNRAYAQISIAHP
jgi:hypothetical protein